LTFVLDASVTLAWCFRDETGPEATRILEQLGEKEAVAPGHWPLEVGNALLAGERRKRLRVAETTRLLSILGTLPIEVMDTRPDHVPGLITLARETSLTVYDAAYLNLALQEGFSLATFDEGLRRAAKKLGVVLL
jgi:predicted nucleic acid-binding protein